MATSSPPSTTSTSWAAAAGKGLPASEAATNGGAASSSASKQLEQLNSVREALFSQDGWGGSNVKQDTSWDVDSRANGQDAGGPGAGGPAGAAGGPGGVPPMGPKDANLWGGAPRNDGTDLWKSTLSGQPPAPKPQPANPWGHSPQNPTDYKQWGEEEDPSTSGFNNDNTVWRDQPGNHMHFSEYCFTRFTRLNYFF